MLSTMATNSHADLRADLERARLLPYVDPAAMATPWWAWPVVGIGMGVLIALNDVGGAVQGVLSLVCAVVMGLAARAIVNHRGVQPRLRGMPGPLLRLYGLVYGTILVLGLP